MRTLIHEVRLFDGERTTRRADVLIADGVIAAPDDHAVDEWIDGSGHTLLPGLIDGHTHVFDGSLAQALRHGVTTELDMFCLPDHLRRQRRLAASRDDVADLRSAGLLATAPGGHPSQLLRAMDVAALGDAVGAIDGIADPADAERFVAARVAEGADYLKVVIDDGAVHGTTLPALGTEVAAALVAAAHAAGLRVIAHALSRAEVGLALDAGVDGLAHVWVDPESDSQGRTRTAELAARVAAEGVFVITTLEYFRVLAEAATPAPDQVGRGSADRAIETARALHRAGAVLVAGTDATPFAPEHGAGLHRELRWLTTAGLTPEEALAAATSVPARQFGLADRGRIAPGLRADLILVEGNPTREISATTTIRSLWRAGVRHQPAALQGAAG